MRAHIGLVTDTPGLHDQMTPAAYLDFFGQLYGMPRAARQSRIDDLLTMFDLQDASQRRMATFSRGMQQKVALARALLHEPGVLFLDEPTSGLDPMAARMVRDLVVGLKHASRSIVLCTHDLHEAERLADVIAIMRHGRIVASGTAEALRTAASQTTLVQVTLAEPRPEALAILQTDRRRARTVRAGRQPELPRSRPETDQPESDRLSGRERRPGRRPSPRPPSPWRKSSARP